MDSYLDRKTDFTRDLVDRLGAIGPDALAHRTGLLETTVRALLEGTGELMSWEVVSACLAAAGVDGGDMGEARRRWTATEGALWNERGAGLRTAFEQNGHGKPTKVVETHQAKVPWRRLAARHPVRFTPWAEPTFPTGRRLPDPSAAGDIRELYSLLRELRTWAGSPRQSEIEKRSWGTLPDATISAMLQRDRWRAASDRELARVGYFATACGLPAAEVARWVEAYERLRHVPPPDDLALARAEAAELRLRLATAEAEANGLRERLKAAERTSAARTPGRPPGQDAVTSANANQTADAPQGAVTDQTPDAGRAGAGTTRTSTGASLPPEAGQAAGSRSAGADTEPATSAGSMATSDIGDTGHALEAGQGTGTLPPNTNAGSTTATSDTEGAGYPPNAGQGTGTDFYDAGAGSTTGSDDENVSRAPGAAQGTGAGNERGVGAGHAAGAGTEGGTDAGQGAGAGHAGRGAGVVTGQGAGAALKADTGRGTDAGTDAGHGAGGGRGAGLSSETDTGRGARRESGASRGRGAHQGAGASTEGDGLGARRGTGTEGAAGTGPSAEQGAKQGAKQGEKEGTGGAGTRRGAEQERDAGAGRGAGQVPPPGPEARPGPREGWSPRRRRVLAAVGAALMFAAGAGAGTVASGSASTEDRALCFNGTLQLVGSTAFERTADALRRGYEARCQDADVEVRAIGSNEGLRVLTRDNAATTIAMHDGHLKADSDEIRLRGFRGFPVAPIAFAVIVNKDTNVSGLTIRDMRSIYSRDGGPTNWKQLKGGGDVPIRLVSRTEGSGTRTIFEERVLNEPEPELSSRDCLRKDEIRAALRVVRCERSSQAQVLDTVNTIPGTIGYAELHVAANARRYPNLRVLALDGRKAEPSPATDGYQFVAPELFYTYGPPPNDSPASAFLTFLAGDSARRLLQRAGSTSCQSADAETIPACQVN
ncbi:substrate-binding domain-containing protein [Actinomadura roseirufa]|uniref:substrate-binding domain-containing protein n=1 Tax=Actinomadura roseirufa TaxID=2094049 RepID=UPI0013F14938|nr:substrate-binding domain-containing protein [Actinomadura roseirufa]